MKHSTFRIERVIRHTSDGPIIRVGQHPQTFGSQEAAKDTAEAWAAMTEQEDLHDEHFELVEYKPDGSSVIVGGIFRFRFEDTEH